MKGNKQETLLEQEQDILEQKQMRNCGQGTYYVIIMTSVICSTK